MNLSSLTNTEMILIAGVSLLVIAAIAMAISMQQKRKTSKLQTQFGGAEYNRAIEQSGNRKKGEAGLLGRAERVDALHVRELTASDRTRFLESWRHVQSRFVDGPAGAVSEADLLLGDVMATRGYPVGDFEQRAADISVAHPLVLENYRTAHAIAVRQTLGQASTEDLRQAMVHYRSLFDELVGKTIAQTTAA